MYKKSKTLSEPVSREVAAFSVVVEAKLQREGYDLVESWEGFSPDYLIKQLVSKVSKLKEMDPDASPNEFFAKVVTIGSLSVMLAELVSRKQKNPFDLKKNGKSGEVLLKACPNVPSRAGRG